MISVGPDNCPIDLEGLGVVEWRWYIDCVNHAQDGIFLRYRGR